ncbi:MAG: hypothetical protein K6F86_07765 [Lachnospiraceae bacterium]|nr:hypothetical protein [Lachnospiraceae bacterium]
MTDREKYDQSDIRACLRMALNAAGVDLGEYKCIGIERHVSDNTRFGEWEDWEESWIEYSFRKEKNVDGSAEIPDFTVTEYYGYDEDPNFEGDGDSVIADPSYALQDDHPEEFERVRLMCERIEKEYKRISKERMQD